jgi:hypothetical protein
MKYLLILALLPLLLLPACVMPGDIESLRHNFEAFEAGAITKPVFDARNAEISAEIDARNAAAIEKMKDIPTSPLELLTYVGGIAATIAGSVKTTNVLRDKRREQRGEVTGNAPAAPPTVV